MLDPEDSGLASFPIIRRGRFILHQPCHLMFDPDLAGPRLLSCPCHPLRKKNHETKAMTPLTFSDKALVVERSDAPKMSVETKKTERWKSLVFI